MRRRACSGFAVHLTPSLYGAVLIFAYSSTLLIRRTASAVSSVLPNGVRIYSRPLGPNPAPAVAATWASLHSGSKKSRESIGARKCGNFRAGASCVELGPAQQ